MQVVDHVALAPMTTLGLGGPARRFCEPTREADLPEALATAKRHDEPVLVVGGGSNLVIADEGFPGLVLRLAVRGVRIERDGDAVLWHVAAGEPWDELCAAAVSAGLSGLECLSGIPGSAGATPIQNVGAYGQEVADTIVRVRAYDREREDVVELPAAACGFAYRHSLFRHNPRFIVLEVSYRLTPGPESRPVRYAELCKALGVAEGEPCELGAVRQAVLALRRQKGMVIDGDDPESRSVGSFFVNPILSPAAAQELVQRCATLPGSPRPPSFGLPDGRIKVPAAWLVERAGFAKGFGEGRVGVSRKHALALVHRGGGSTRELVALARQIRAGVEARLGVLLQPEPVLVGVSLAP